MLLASESNRNNVFNKLCKLILHFRENNLEYKENAFGCNSNDGMIKNNCEKLDNSKEVQLDNQALQSDKVSKGVKKNSEARQQDFIKDIRTQLVELVEAYKKYYEDGRINCKLADKIIAKLVEYKSISNKENELKLIDDILNNKEFLSKNHTGYSAEMVGRMILDFRGLTMCFLQRQTLIFLYLIQKCILIRVVRLLKRLILEL